MDDNSKEASEGMVVVRVLAAVLERLVNSNAQQPNLDPGAVTKFHALRAPGISILQYLERIHKYASCSTECFILALVYIDRLIQRNNFLLTELNVHRVIISAVLLAAKFFDDAYYNNAYYAKVGGVLVSEINGLEVEFLFRINFSLHVSPEVFMKYQAELLSHAIEAGVQETLPVMMQSAIPTYPEPSAAYIPVQYTNISDTAAITCPTKPESNSLRRHITPSPEHQIHVASAPPCTKLQYGNTINNSFQPLQRHNSLPSRGAQVHPLPTVKSPGRLNYMDYQIPINQHSRQYSDPSSYLKTKQQANTSHSPNTIQFKHQSSDPLYGSCGRRLADVILIPSNTSSPRLVHASTGGYYR
jgi:hypothetical protein